MPRASSSFTLCLVLLATLAGCPDAPPPTPQPSASTPPTPTPTAVVAPPTSARAPASQPPSPPAPQTTVYKRRGGTVRGELISPAGADPIVLLTEHGRVSLPRTLVKYVRRPGDPPPPPDVLDLESRAGAGDLPAMVALGVVLEHGRGVPADPAGAFRWYRRAAMAGSAAGMSRLAWAYQHGLGAPVDPDGYKRWVMRAAQAGDPFARGAACATGLLPGGALAAREAYRAAAEADDARGCRALATMLLAGKGGPRDATMARVWLTYGARLGNAACMADLGELLEGGGGSISEAVRWYRASAKQGDPRGLTALGRLHSKGLGVTRDAGRAVAFWQQAARLGRSECAEAMASLGRALEAGRGVKRDLNLARLWYARAAQHGHAGAAARLRRLRRSSR